ncbi:MAG: RNA polymerase sigma factor [Clostridia bacterium]|nr:RNA polymerase sigma factor [Clostridia bacterium]
MTKKTKTANSSLVELFWNRDERAIAETQREYGDYCFIVAKNILGNEQDAEECVNDTYLRAWNSIPPAKPANFKAYIAKITHNLCIDRLKQRGADKRNAVIVAFEELEETLFSDHDHISEGIKLSELQVAINRFLYTQSARRRAMFLLRYFYGESVGAVAKKTGTSESNVSKMLKITREELKEYLLKEGYYV